MTRFLIALSFAASVAITPSPAAETAVPISVDARHEGPVIDRHIFGQFAEHLGRGIEDGVWVGPTSQIPNTRGIRKDVVAALKALHVPVVRWPGGCFADKYHWENGVGPRAKRPVTLNPDWGGVEEKNGFGSHEYFDFLSQIGADAYLSVNVGTGTPREAAEWLEYLTSDKDSRLAARRRANGRKAPFSVEYLGVGNEMWGCGGSMSADHYAEELMQFATFAVNFNTRQEKMKVAASGADSIDYAWTETVMKTYRNHIYSWNMDAISLHRYSATETWPPKHPATGFDEDEYAAVLKNTLEMETIVSKHIAIMDKYDPEKKVALYVDEWGAWYPVEKGTNPHFLYQQNSQRDAILAALNLNIFMRHADRVKMSNIAQMVNVLQAMILTKGDKIVLTPTYHVYRLYIPFHEAVLLPVTFDAGIYAFKDAVLPRLDVIGAKGKDGAVYLALVNVDPGHALDVDLTAMGFDAKQARGESLTAPRIDAVNDFDAPSTVVPRPVEARAEKNRLVLTLSPESVTVVKLN